MTTGSTTRSTKKTTAKAPTPSPAPGTNGAKKASTKTTQKPALTSAAPKGKGKTPTQPAQATMSLLPAYDALGVPAQVVLTDLPPNTELIGPAPDDGFVRNIKEFGVLQPVVLIRRTSGGYIVAGGRRRPRLWARRDPGDGLPRRLGQPRGADGD